MGTNYYLRIIPTASRKELIKAHIDGNQFDKIDFDKWYYGSINEYDAEEQIKNQKYGLVHLGKRSGGWRFLWNPNVYHTGYKEWTQLYDLSEEGIRQFFHSFDGRTYVVDEYHLYGWPLLSNESVAVNKDNYDVYESVGQYPVDVFMKMALDWGKKFTPDNQYDEEHTSGAYTDHKAEFHDWLLEKYPDAQFRHYDYWVNGLRFAGTVDFG